MKTAVIYARYSSERQTEQSIEGQVYVCTQFAEQNDIIIVDSYIDRAMTGKNDNRAAFQRMLKDSDKKAWDYVLVYKLDRFSRNKYEMAIHKKHLRDNGIRLKSATENIPDTPEGIILESMLEGMAEYYSAELSQKIKRGMNESRKKGLFTGGVLPFGYKLNNKKIEVNEDEAYMVRTIFEQYANGTFVKDIREELTSKNILRNGKPFPINTIYNLLKNEKYIGIYRVGNEVYTNIYPRIVPDALFECVQAKINENKTGKHIDTTQYLLKNRMFCGICGKPMTSESGTARNGTVSRYYKCLARKKQNACKKSIVRKDLIERLVIDTTIKILSDNQILNNLADQILVVNKQRINDSSILNVLEKEQTAIQRSINNILKAIENGITTSSTKQRLEELEAELASIKVKISIERSKEKISLKKDDILNYIKTAIHKSPQQIIRQLINKIIIYDDKVEIFYNYTEHKNPDDEHRDFLFYKTKYSEKINMHLYKFQSSFEGRFITYEFDVLLYIS